MSDPDVSRRVPHDVDVTSEIVLAVAPDGRRGHSSREEMLAQ